MFVKKKKRELRMKLKINKKFRGGKLCFNPNILFGEFKKSHLNIVS